MIRSNQPPAVTIEKRSVMEIMGNPRYIELIDEYAWESAVVDMPAINAKMETYVPMESTGMLNIFAAFAEGELIGFVSVLTPTLPHYGALVATTESFFVTAGHRGGGTGLKLLKRAEDFAWEQGSPGLFVSAPTDGMLATILPRWGYVQTSLVFFKKAP